MIAWNGIEKWNMGLDILRTEKEITSISIESKQERKVKGKSGEDLTCFSEGAPMNKCRNHLIHSENILTDIKLKRC
ncbi:hypothetical protein Avbf_16254 [Armadillidium vulgare]|nr:hypothetical protein Avbf_16254 [Armadillidium vulgare]